MKGIKYEDVEKALKYVQSQECRVETNNNLAIQIAECLNYQYPNSLVTMDLEREILNIEGDNKEEILNDIKEIGLI